MNSHTSCGYSTVLVRWADAHCGNGGWQEMADYDDDGEYMIETVGFLVPEGRPGAKTDHVTLWQTVNEDEGIHPFHIPSAMVRDIIVLVPAAPSKRVDVPLVTPFDEVDNSPNE